VWCLLLLLLLLLLLSGVQLIAPWEEQSPLFKFISEASLIRRLMWCWRARSCW